MPCRQIRLVLLVVTAIVAAPLFGEESPDGEECPGSLASGVIRDAAEIEPAEAERIFASAEAAIYFPDLRRARWLEVSAEAISISQLAANVGQASVADFRGDLETRFPAFSENSHGPYLLKVPSTETRLTPREARSPMPGAVEPAAMPWVESFENGLTQWQLADNATGDYTFATTGCAVHSGTWSADAVRGGVRGQHLFCWENYPPSAVTQITHNACEAIQGAAQAWLDFHFTTAMADGESIGVYYFADGYLRGYSFTGTWSGWFHVVLNLKQWSYVGDLTTQSCPKVVFQFKSDASNTAGAGVQIDDVTIRTDAPPFLSCSISATPASGPAPLTVSFLPVVAGSSGSESVEWRFGDASNTVSTERLGAFTYTAPGDFDVRLRVIDSSSARAYATRRIHVDAAPACSLGCAASVPLSATTGTPASFHATATPIGCGGSPSFAWNFGDGQTSAQPAVTHSYSTPGTYHWTLVTTIDGVTCSKTGSITVSTQATRSRSRAVHRPPPPGAFEVVVNPSAVSQTFTSEDLSVTIPGGLLTAPRTLKIAKVTNPPAPNFPGQGIGAAFDVTLGDLHQFNLPIQLRLRYDATKIRTDIDVRRSISAAYFDTGQGVWVEVPSKIDESAKEVLVETNHLTTWGWTMWLAGYPVVENSLFTLSYDRTEINDPLKGPAYKPDDRSNHVDPNTHDYIEDTFAYLGIAFQRYKNAGFKLPPTPINVWVGGSDPSQRAKFFGQGLTINLNSITQAQLKMDTAHELFHSFEGAYLTAVGMGVGEIPFVGWSPPVLSWSVWYVESAAEYAAEYVAWDGTLHQMGGKLRRDYLSFPLYDVHETHDYGYSTAHFVKYLVSRGAAFKPMSESLFGYDWTNLNDYYYPLHEYLERALGSGNGLPRQYQAFARYFVFDAASPMPPIQDSLHSEVAAYRSTLADDAPETVTFDLPGGYTAKLWGIWVSEIQFDTATPKKKFTVSIDGELPAKVEIDVVVLKKDQRLTGGSTPIGTLTQTVKAVEVEVEKGDAIYVLAVSTDSVQRYVKVRIGGDPFTRLSLGQTEYTFLCTAEKCEGWCGVRSGDDGITYVSPLTWKGNVFRFDSTPGSYFTGELSADYKTILWFEVILPAGTWIRWVNLPLDTARSTADTLVFATTGEAARSHIAIAKVMICESDHAGIDYSKLVKIELWLAK